MKVEHEGKEETNEISMIRWMCWFTMKERKRNAELRQLLVLETVSLVIKRGT